MLRCSGELIQSFLRNPDQSRRPSLGALAGGGRRSGHRELGPGHEHLLPTLSDTLGDTPTCFSQRPRPPVLPRGRPSDASLRPPRPGLQGVACTWGFREGTFITACQKTPVYCTPETRLRRRGPQSPHSPHIHVLCGLSFPRF